MTKGNDQEFVKAARLLWGGRWMVPLAQAARVTPINVQDELDDSRPVGQGLASVLVRSMEEQEDRLRRRRVELVAAYAARGVRL